MKRIIPYIIIAILLIIILRTIISQKRAARKKLWTEKCYGEEIVKATEAKRSPEEPDTSDIWLKIQMYIISLWLLFVLLIPITIELPEYVETQWIFSWKENMIPMLCVVMIIVGYLLFKQLEYRWKGTADLSVEVINIESENYEYLTFFATYIIPLVCINLDERRYVVLLAMLLIIIGAIFVQSDFYLGNPMLALMHYKLYRVQYMYGDQKQEKMIISKDKIRVGDWIEAIPFDKNTWYVRRCRS